jgi:hypothetical protein
MMLHDQFVIRLLLRVLLVVGVYLVVSFLFTLIDVRPWASSHAANIFRGWKGMIFFPVWVPYRLLKEPLDRPLLIRGVAFVLSVAGLSVAVIRWLVPRSRG